MEMLESEYKLIGSHKVIELIADDICQLRDEFYPIRHENQLWKFDVDHHLDSLQKKHIV